MAEPLQKTRNFLRKIIYSDCAEPFSVYAETFFPAFLRLWIAATIPDLSDMVRSRGEKIAAAGARAGRGGSHLHRKRTSGFTPSQERFAAKGLQTLLVVTQPLETAGFALLMYSATEDFFYNWQTAIEIKGQCSSPPEAGPLQRSDANFGMFPNTILGGMFLTNLDQNRANWPTDGLGVGVPIGTYNVSVAATVVERGGGGATYRAGITTVGGIISGTRYGPGVFCAGGKPTGVMGNWDVAFYTGVGGSIAWGIAGPPVPVGLGIEKARAIVSRIG